MSVHDAITFDADDPNATISGHRYPEFYHDAERSIVLREGSLPCALIGFVDRGPVPYVVQLQGSRECPPPKHWERMLLERFTQELFINQPLSFVVRSGSNNPYAAEFHLFLAVNAIYDESGLGFPSFSEALRLDESSREKIDERLRALPLEDLPKTALHPSLARLRYDVTARRFARSNGLDVTTIDDALAGRFGALAGDLLIRRSPYE